MVLEIKWTDEAKFQFKDILDYWEARNGTNTYSEKLLSSVEATIARLTEFPEIERKTENQRIRLPNFSQNRIPKRGGTG